MKLGLILEGGASRGYFSCGILEALEREGRVFVIAPSEKLNIERTEGDPKVLGDLYDLGYRRFYEIWPELKQYLAQ